MNNVNLIERIRRATLNQCKLEPVTVRLLLMEAADELERVKLYDTLAHANREQAKEIERLRALSIRPEVLAEVQHEKERWQKQHDQLHAQFVEMRERWQRSQAHSAKQAFAIERLKGLVEQTLVAQGLPPL